MSGTLKELSRSTLTNIGYVYLGVVIGMGCLMAGFILYMMFISGAYKIVFGIICICMIVAAIQRKVTS